MFFFYIKMKKRDFRKMWVKSDTFSNIVRLTVESNLKSAVLSDIGTLSDLSSL